MKKYLLWSLFLLICAMPLGLRAQEVADTVEWSNLRQLMQELELQRQVDMTHRLQLEEQLRSLRSGNELQRESLLGQIEALRQKDSLLMAERKQRIDALRSSVRGFPVMNPLGTDTLFHIHARLGSLTAAERALAVSEKIAELAADMRFEPDSVKLQPADLGTELVARNRILLTITSNDAIWNNSSISELAELYRARIITSIEEYREETSLTALAKEVSLALMVIVLLILCIFLGKRLFRFTSRRIISLRDGKLKGYRIRNYTVLDTARQIRILLVLNHIAKWLFTIALIYASLLVLFGIFPWTQHFANQLFSWVLNPMRDMAKSVMQYTPNLITIIIIIIVFRFVLKGVAFVRKEIENGALVIPGFHAEWANPTYQIIRVLLMAFMLIVIFPYLPGSDTPVFRGVSVFLGVLFTFGSSGSLNNIVSGLILTYMRSYKIGDRVQIGEVTGDIIERTVLVTRIRTIKNEIISIPNAKVMNSHTTNYSSDAADLGLILHTTVTIAYTVPWQKVHAALIKAANATPHLLQSPGPFILHTSLNEFHVSYQLNAYTREPNIQHETYSELHKHIQECCEEAGITLLSPHYRAWAGGQTDGMPKQ